MGQNVELKIQFLPRRKHSASVIKTDKLLLYREIIAVCSHIHTRHINRLRGAERRIIYKDTVRTAQKTLSALVIKTDKLLLYREIMAVCSQIHTKHTNTLCGQNAEFLNVNSVGT